MNGMHPRFSPCSVGVANLATRSFRNNGGRCMESAAATSPWLPPGGSCHDEISASRNRYFVVTDEGRRWLKVLDFPVKWRKPEHIPLIQLHSFTNLSPPLISLATLSSFLPGEAKGQLREPVPFNALLCSIRKWAAAPLGSPSWRPLQGVEEAIGLQQPTHYTPSVSPFGLPAPPKVEPRALRASGSPNWRPLQACANVQPISSIPGRQMVGSFPFATGAFLSM